MLECVALIMKDEKNREAWGSCQEKLELSGLRCANLPEADSGMKGKRILVITDDGETAGRCAGLEIACGAFCPQEAGSFFFPHVQMVWESPERVERTELEQLYCRFHGLPVLIAETERLRLRESLPGDYEALREMEEEAGWSFDVTETREKFLSYLKYVYMFYGYGYWTAELADTGEIVGWCGFAAWGKQERQEQTVYMKLAGPSDCQEAVRLELGYLVSRARRGQGLALEMCRAALAYAFETLGAGSVWVQIDAKNQASLRLAEKLGFRETV